LFLNERPRACTEPIQKAHPGHPLTSFLFFIFLTRFFIAFPGVSQQSSKQISKTLKAKNTFFGLKK
jgi:hypothetical protein